MGWDVGFLLGQNPITGYNMDNGSWYVNVTGPNPGIVSPEFTQQLLAENTVLEFSMKAWADVNPVDKCTLWVKDEHGSWNNPIKVSLNNAAYGYNNGNFKNRDYNIYLVDFSGIRSQQWIAQTGNLVIRQFSIQLTKGTGRPNEYWAIDWMKIYSKHGDRRVDDYVNIAYSGQQSYSLSSYSSGPALNISSAPSVSGSVTPPSPPPAPRYQYSGAWTCQGFASGTISWSMVPVNPKIQFNQGEDVSCLVELKNISVNHRVKVDIYKDSVYSWTWGGVTWNNVGSGTWSYSYAQVTNSNAYPGNYEFRISIDTGAGFQQIDSKWCNVLSTQPRYVYSGAWVCDSIASGPVQWSQMAVNTKTYFNQGSKVSLLAEYKNIYVNHRHKVDIYYNGAYSWTWDSVTWHNVGQTGLGYSYATPYASNCLPGDYEFRVFIDTGTGFKKMDSKTFTVFQSGPQYSYTGAWTCDSVADGTEPYSKVPVNPKTTFVQGHNAYCLAVLHNICVNHRVKVDVYQNGAYSWTWGSGNWNIVGSGWTYSNAVVVNSQVSVGSYQFKIYLDIGSGYQLIDTKNITVISN